jgi:transcriptional regulator with XRE-family HTH domain
MTGRAVKRDRRLRIRLALLERNLTHAKIAKRLGISHSRVTQILTLAAPGYRYRGRIARMLGIPKEELFPGPQTPRKPGPKPKHSAATAARNGEGHA